MNWWNPCKMENEEDGESLEDILKGFSEDSYVEVIYTSIPERYIKVFRIISDEYEFNIIRESIDAYSGDINIKVKDRMRKTAEVLKRTIGVI